MISMEPSGLRINSLTLRNHINKEVKKLPFIIQQVRY